MLSFIGMMTDCVTLRVSGCGKEKFMNFCSDNNINLSNIFFDDFGMLCTMRAADFKKTRPCVKRAGVHVCIVRKKGAGIYFRLRRRRYGFFGGAFAALIFMIYLTSHIWVIDIIGNETIPDNTIYAALEKHGLKTGSFKYGYDMKKFQNDMLLELDSLSWIWVNIDGTKAVVQVREKGDTPEIADKNQIYNIIASQNGYITDIIAKSGRCVVNVGDVVNEGDLLISGIGSTAYKGNRYIHSYGSVFAKTSRTKSGEYNHTKTVCTLSGKKTNKISFTLFGHKFKLFLNGECEYKYFEKKKYTKKLKIFNNFYLPITFTRETFCEIIRKDVAISDSEAVAAAVKKLTSDIESERSDDAKTIKKEYKYSKNNENGNLTVTVTVDSIENIAVPVKIETYDSEENTVG